MGEFQYKPKLLIRIQPNLPEWIASQTLIHECIHAIDMHANLRMNEEEVAKLEICLWDFIRDNPALIRIIQRGK